jgi:hypothetical protein
MSKSDAFETALLGLLFNNTNIANIGDATGVRSSTTAGSLFFALHTADPGEAGSQTTNEVAYTSYARVGVARSGAGFVVTGNSVSPVADVTFPECTGGTATATHFSIGTGNTGVSGTVLYKGSLTPSIAIATGVTPRIRNTSTVTED